MDSTRATWHPARRPPGRDAERPPRARRPVEDGSRGTGTVTVHDVHGATVERRFLVACDREAREDADDRGDGYGDHDAREAEERTAREEREEDPQRVEPDLVADEVRGEHVVVQHLAGGEDPGHHHDPTPFRPELIHCHPDRGGRTPERADVRYERDGARREPDQETRF